MNSTTKGIYKTKKRSSRVLSVTIITAIPGLNIGVSILNAVIAGGIVAAVGEVSVYAFEQVYLGKKSLEDLDWITKLAKGFIDTLTKVLEQLGDGASKEQISKAIIKAIKNAKWV
ncbi:hypothetical protein [Butyrivibrio sp. MB2005]|uniref:hypothetical protein n=1 Tax=Butyrivibrio sp. MB2005 TaxID=1280678 RepID=UPI00040ADE35|nr:hypothetical protein [Butyrivibrio sp. MB2005]